MFLKDRRTDDLVRILDLDGLRDPQQEYVLGRDQAGEEEQDPLPYTKEQLVFPSDEPLPRCWTQVRYRAAARAAELAGAVTSRGRPLRRLRGLSSSRQMCLRPLFCRGWNPATAKERDHMATVDKFGGNWVIVRSHTRDTPDGINGALESHETAASTNREFWTGDGWAGQYGFARYFATKEEAEACLAQHRHEILCR